MEITPYLMDHGAFDAYAFLVRHGNQSLLYTGDFRSHGRKSKLFYEFLHEAPKNINWLLMEGTTLSRPKNKSRTEVQLESDFVKNFKESKGINFVYLSGQNIDRFVTIYKACKKSRKLFVIDFYIATVLADLAALGNKIPYPSPKYSDIKVFFPNLLQRKIENLNRKDLIDRFAEYKISLLEINNRAYNIVMTIRPSMDCEIKKLNNLKDGNLIYSLWKGYKEKEYTKRFLDNLEKRGVSLVDIHTSGHADYYTLKKLLSAVEPLKVIPIHTLESDNYKNLFPEANIVQVKNGEVIS